jgi:ABC-type spermidine/putrescine transport system permease subunit I
MRSKPVDSRPIALEPDEQRPKKRKKTASLTRDSGVHYPRWYWPSFATPSIIYLLVLFVLPFYVVFAVAFGTVDIFQNPVPVYQPWYWTTTTLSSTVDRFFGPAAFYQSALIRTLTYVPVASLICLVLGYAVAYFVARYGGKRKNLYLVLLIAPFWISYLMRIYAWQGLLVTDGILNKILIWLHIISTPVGWLQGKPVTVILGLVYGYIPYMVLPIYGQLDRIDKSMLEAGRDLGASPFHTFRRVTLPLSRQAILAGLVIVSLPMFGDYFTNNLLGTTKTSMYGNLIDNSLTSPGGSAQAACLVLILIILLLIPLLYYLRATKREAERA